MSSLLHDIVFAARLLRKSPAFTAAAILTLGLGVGANAAVFSIVNALILRPLPVRDSDRLVVLARQPHSSRALSGVSAPDLEPFHDLTSDVLEDIGGYSAGYSTLSPGAGRPEWVTTTEITGNYFSALDVKAAIGRLIGPADVVAGRMSPIVVLGYDTWQRRYGADPSVVGRPAAVNGRTVTIVGVAPAGFDGTFAFMRSEIYLPLTWGFGWPILRAQHAITRLKPGVSIERAQAAIDVVAARLAERDPDRYGDVSLKVVPERLARPEEDEARWNGLASSIILVLVGLVLTVSAVNVTNLLLSRAVDRRAELAIRAALGAGRARIARQFLAEAVLLTVIGAAAGMLFAVWTTRLLAKIEVPGARAANLDFHPDLRVLAFGVVITLVTGLFVGLAPALQATRMDLEHALREASQQSTGGRTRVRVRNLLVVSQIAACFILLVVAGLFTRSLAHAESVDLGFEPRRVLNVMLSVNQLAYDEPQGRDFFERLEERVRKLPGVEEVAFGSHLPMGYVRSGAVVEAEGRQPAAKDRVLAGLNSVTPSYFGTLKVPIVQGRAFIATDDERSRRVAIVNRRFADVLWPGENPIGRRFTIPTSDDDTPLEVVGVTRTGKYDFVFEDPTPYVFLPIAQRYAASRVLHVRTAGAPEAIAPAVQRVIADLEPNLAPFDIMSMERSLGGGAGFFLVRHAARFATILGALALALAVIGLYGVVAYTVSQRSHEIGVRVALGATPVDVARLVVGQGSAMVLAGIGIGIVVALAGSRFVAAFLFGVTPLDPVTFAAVGLVLAIVGTAACGAPAIRAMRANPIVALREL
jgi:predicted permease